MTYQARRLPLDGRTIADRVYSTVSGNQPVGDKTMAVRVSPAFLKKMNTYEPPPPSDAERWQPEIGDQIAGELVEVKTVATDNGDATVIVVNDVISKRQIELFLNTTLRSAWAREKPQIGEIIGVKYVDDQVSKQGNTYKRLVLFLDRGEKLPGIDDEADVPKPKAKAAQDDSEDPFADE